MFLSFRKRIFFTIAIFLCLAQAVLAVTSVVTRHRKSDDFLKGKTDQVSIDSEGVLRLASRQTHLALGDSLSGVWTINTAVVSQDGTWFIGTSPNGTIVKASGSNAVRIYPETSADSSSEPNSLIAPIRNEHVFALNFDAAGRLLAGISGQKGTLIRFSGSAEILFESEADKYIFAIVTDENGSIYFGTGPEGKIYRIAPFGGSAELVYDSRDKNILSLLFTREGELIAGSDTKGLVYKIDVENKTAVVLYDSAQAEITALAEDENGNLYAAASSVAAVAGQIDSVSTALSKSPGRPDTSVSGSRSSSAGKSLKTASTSEKDDKSEPSSQPQPPKPTGPKSDSQIYKITPQGFVTEIFSEKAVFYSLIFHDGKLFAATGNNGRLYSIDPETETRSIVYEDEKSLQITDSVPIENDLLLALSNPAGLVRLSESIAERGVYTSDLLDAGQPARWGKLQIEADIPDGCGVSFACRSGNVEDPNDPAFSEWSEEKELLRPEEMDCPVGRYAQYRLILHGCNAEQTPVIREVAVSHSIPNLAPRVAAVQVLPGKDKQKPHVMQIIAKADDENKDTLVYHYEFRRLGRDKWIKLEKDSVKPVVEWDTRTVEDGRYEVRVSADDKPTNSPSEALIGSRISDPVVVDNTPPKIEDADLKIEGQTLVLRFLASDAYSVVGKAQFTIDSNEKWAGILPEDLVFDTTEEWIRLQVDDLEKGNHILAIAVSDDPGNTAYQTFEFTVQ